jgi:hypothetical protein
MASFSTTARAERELMRNGNPPPEFHVDSTKVRVTVRIVK